MTVLTGIPQNLRFLRGILQLNIERPHKIFNSSLSPESHETDSTGKSRILPLLLSYTGCAHFTEAASVVGRAVDVGTLAL